MTQQYRKRMQGLTMIELMIVVVVIGILAMIAYPSYQEQVRKTRRADAKTALMDTAQELERCFTRFSAYNAGGCGVVLPEPSSEGWYIVSGAPGATAYTLAATPQLDQTNDTKCGILLLSSDGKQGSQNDPDADANNCW
jgi:type IV pilus assembly protein PilE